jgi:3-oxocholest-4-en-26-oyl-CoA dehydrogenase beta subunit
MNFTFSEEQVAVRGLAIQVFGGLVTSDRLKAVEATDDRFDRELWGSLAEAGLLALAVPEAHGGSGLGIQELCLVAEQQGRVVAPLPLVPTLAAALTLAEHGTPGQQAAWLPGVAGGSVVLATALDGAGLNDPFAAGVRAVSKAFGGYTLTGFRPAVAGAHVAQTILVPASIDGGAIGMFIVAPDSAGLTAERSISTNRQIISALTFADVVVGSDALVGGPAVDGEAVLRHLVFGSIVLMAAQQIGIAEEITKLAAGYTSTRFQFGKPLSTFQGVSHRLADNYIDTEAMRVTMQAAAWRMAEGLDATSQVMVAKWWAAEGGHRVIHGAQHVHGGMGADIEYPSHRYFLWGKQIEASMGCASAWLSRLGAVLAARAARAAS